MSGDRRSHRTSAGLALSALLLTLSVAAGAATGPLEFGLPPYLSTRSLLAMFKPLASFLEHRLQQPVMLVTAPAAAEFDDRLQAEQYDLAIASPHTARLVQRDQTYEPLLRFTADLYGVLLVRSDSPYHALRDLAGKTIALPQRSTATYLLGKEMLERGGLGTTHAVTAQGFQDTLLMGLLRGDYPAALINPFALARAHPEDRQQVRQIAQTRRITHMMLVARANLSRSTRDNIAAVVTEFMEKTPEGAHFLQETGLGGVRPPSEAELRSLDTLAAEQRRIWEEQRTATRHQRQ